MMFYARFPWIKNKHFVFNQFSSMPSGNLFGFIDLNFKIFPKLMVISSIDINKLAY